MDLLAFISSTASSNPSSIGDLKLESTLTGLRWVSYCCQNGNLVVCDVGVHKTTWIVGLR